MRSRFLRSTGRSGWRGLVLLGLLPVVVAAFGTAYWTHGTVRSVAGEVYCVAAAVVIVLAWQLDVAKLEPVAYAMLAAKAKADGDDARAAAYLADAQGVINAHADDGQEAGEVEYVVAEPKRHWSQGPFHHVEGLDAEVDYWPWEPDR